MEIQQFNYLQGYSAIFGVALEIADKNVDFPAFGNLK